jgi:hypothetical protein
MFLFCLIHLSGGVHDGIREDIMLDDVPAPDIYEGLYDYSKFDWVIAGALQSVPATVEGFLAESVSYTEKFYQPHFLRITVPMAEGIVHKSILEATVFEVEDHVRNSRQSATNAEFKRFIREDRHFCDTLHHWLSPRALQEIFRSYQRPFKLDGRHSGLAFFKAIMEQIQCPMELNKRTRISGLQY